MMASTAQNRRPQRLILDTNVWRYIVDDNAIPHLLKHTRKYDADILIAPSVLYEAMRSGDALLRQKLVSSMAMKKWCRLMPEAFSESQELLEEIRRVRPDWLKIPKQPQEFIQLRYDWSRRIGGFWDRARFNTEQEASYISTSNGDLEIAREGARNRRDDLKNSSWKESHPLKHVWVDLPLRPAGWGNKPVEAWRALGWMATGNAISRGDHPYREWLSDFVDLDKIQFDSTGWVKFWLFDIDLLRMPRAWLRWAFEHLQQFRKVTDGAPCDVQLATYLLDADCVVSADKTFIQLVERVRTEAPFTIARGICVPGGIPGIEALFEVMSTCGQR